MDGGIGLTVCSAIDVKKERLRMWPLLFGARKQQCGPSAKEEA